MRSILAIDIGNTNITAGAFKDGKLVKKAKIPSGAHSMHESAFRALCKKFTRKCGSAGCDIVISSVVPLALARVVFSLKKLGACRITVLGKDAAVPIKNLYKKKLEVGQDRLVNAFAAKSLYGSPSVIVDFGTAITFDIVSRKGEYLGGLILPGIEMSFSSLYNKTALLPRVELKRAPSIIGTDTVNSMRGGILFGFGAMCDGLVAQYRKILGKDTKVIATGGNAGLIQRYAKSIQIVDPDLTLKGLALIQV